MPKEEDTPVPIGVKKSHSQRISKLEDGQKELVEGQGKLAGDIGNVSNRVKVLEDEYEARNSDRPSNAQVSIGPTGARAKFHNINGRVLIGVVVVIALTIVLITLILEK